MKAYYAHPITLYGSIQEQKDKELLESLGFIVVNPSDKDKQDEYEKGGFQVFLDWVSKSDCLAFRSFIDMSISAGVMREIQQAIKDGKPVIELQTKTI